MSITPLHPVIRNFFETLTFAENHYIAFVDLRLAAIGQAQLEIDKLSPTEKELCYKGFETALLQLHQMGLIYKYEAIKDGFIIYPQNKTYIDENHLKLLFTKEQDYDIA